MQYFQKISLPVFVLIVCSGFILLQNQPIFAILLQNPDVEAIPKSSELQLTSVKDIPRTVFILDRHLKAGHYNEVTTISKRVLDLQKNNIEAHAYLAAAYKGLNENETHLEEVAIVKKISPYSPALFKAMASFYLSLQDMQLAEQTYKEGINSAKNTSDLHMGLAALYLQKGETKEAEKQYREVLRQKDLGNQHFLNANFALCRMELQEKAYDAVIKRAGTITDFYPPVPQGHYFLGTAYIGKKEPKKAVKVYENFMKINPDSPLSYQELALLHNDTFGNHKKGLSYARKAVQKFPEDAKSHDLMGWILLQNQKYSEALKHFQNATRLELGNPMYLYHLGLAHQEMNEKLEATKAFELAVILIAQNPSNGFAEELKKRIGQCKQ